MPDNKSISFVKQLCFGEIHEDLVFPFPKMKSEERDTLLQMKDSFATWLGPKANEFRKWDVEGEMPAEFIQEMREFGLFSLIVPEEFGGLNLSSTAYSRTLQELAMYDGSVAITAGAHSSIGMKGLLLFGTKEQKARYLPKLATGEMIAAFCLTEPESGSDAASIKTKAEQVEDGWILSGEKLWITNGGIADFFTVFARTNTKDGQITAFIVTKDMPGVRTSMHEDKMGLRASSTTSVYLDNVKVGREHLLGEVGKGFKIAMKILNSGRTGLGGGAVGSMKRAIRLATKQAKERKQFGKSIAEFGMIKQKVGQMIVDCYAAESTVCMVGSLIDQDHEDYAVEAAISKVFATETLWRTLDEALQIAGGMGYMREQPYERMMRDARINRIFEGTNEILRLFVGLSGMNDVGQSLKELSKSVGNVMNDPIKGFGVLSDYAKRRVTQVTGLGRAQLAKVHPQLKPYAVVLEENTQKLAAAVDKVLRKHGKEIIHMQFATRRIGDIMIDMYVLSCVISRVDASIAAKGLDGAAKEIEILEVFCGQARRRMRLFFRKIDQNDDEIIKSLADHAFEEGRFIWDNI